MTSLLRNVSTDGADPEMEQTHAHPSFPRRASTAQKVRQMWTPEEDRTLSNAVARGKSIPKTAVPPRPCPTSGRATRIPTDSVHAPPQRRPAPAPSAGTKSQPISPAATTKTAASGGATASPTPSARAPGARRRTQNCSTPWKSTDSAGARSPRRWAREMATKSSRDGGIALIRALTRAPGRRPR